ncbi:MAG: hypothetical protein ACREID_03690 [Planctomycetota bacterium]
MSTRLAAPAALLLLLSPLAAQEAPPAMAVQFYDVEFLTRGVLDRVAPNLTGWRSGAPLPGSVDARGADAAPSFSLEELMELVRTHASPASWDAMGASLGATRRFLVVRNTPEAQERVRETLDMLAAAKGRLVRTEAWILAGTPPDRPRLQAREADELVAARRAEGGVVAEGFSLGFLGQRAPVSLVRQRAHLVDYDVEVAEGANADDPVVGIALDGVVVDVRAHALPDGGLLIDVASELARGPDRIAETPAATGYLPLARVESVLSTFRGEAAVAAGEAAVVNAGGGAGGGSFLVVRCTPIEPPAAAYTDADPVVAADAGSAEGALTVVIHDISALTHASVPGRTWRHDRIGLLVPTRFEFPQTEEDVDPVGDLAPDLILELLRSNIAPASWEREGVSARPLGPHLVIAQSAGVQERIAKALGMLARRATREIVLDARLVKVPAAQSAAFFASHGCLLTRDLAAQLLAIGQDAAGGRAAALPGRPLEIASVREAGYVAEWDVEIAGTKEPPPDRIPASVGYDPVVSSARDGLLITATLLPAGSSAYLLEFDATLARMELPMREMRPPEGAGFGTMQLPEMTTFRCGGTLLLPAGASAVAAGAVGADGNALLLVLTPGVGD